MPKLGKLCIQTILKSTSAMPILRTITQHAGLALSLAVLQHTAYAGMIIPTNVTVNRPAEAEVPIHGKVTDANGEQLPGVSVQVKGSKRGTLTRADGSFQIAAPEHAVLVFSYLGYQTQEISISGQQSLQIKLANDDKKLSEVVVVGYGTQDRRNLTSSVASIQAAETKQVPVASFDAQLQGKAAGLQINSNTGTPGDGVFVRVRGTTSINASNDPLYIIDGVFVSNSSLQTVNTGGRSTSPLADINPADIEHIEVLKDASATAIYGSRGANGVVIVTTRRGSYAAKTRINANVSHGWAKADRLWKLTTGPQHATLENEYWVNTGIDNPALNMTYANRPFRPVSEGGRGNPEDQKTYDRLDELFRTAQLADYDLSLDGGSDKTKFYIGGGYTNQEADIRPINFERASLKLNIDHKVNDRVTVGVSNSISRTHRNQARAGDGPQGGLLQAALHTPTYLPETNADGTPARWAGFDNLEVLIHNYDVQTVSLRYIGNAYIEAELIPHLKFRTSWSLDYNNYNESEYWNSLTLLGAPPTNGLATSTITQNSAWINEQTLSYQRQLGRGHSISAVVGNTLQSNVLQSTAAQGTGFPNDSYKDISAASVTTSGQAWTKANLSSFFGRLDYNYNSRYYLEVSTRADGSSRFGANHRWGYFPSVGASWRIKDENFLKHVDFLSDLKLRTSYGITGNQSGINDFAARGLWSSAGGYPDNTSSGDKAATGPLQIANADLHWEKTKQANVGVDASFLDNRIGLEFNLYSKYTSDVLLQLPVPANTGFSTYYSNAGEISNKGYEITIHSENIRRKDFSWQTTFSISGNRNRVEKLPVPITEYNRDWIRLQQGYSMYSFWMYKQLYVDPKTGTAVFQDVNKDGQITVADRQIVGNAMPKFFGGLYNTVSWKGFDAAVQFNFQYGNKVLNLNRFFGEGGGTRDASRVMFASQLNRWQKPGDITDVPRLTGVGNNYRLDQNSRFLEDGSFLRLQNLTIGYTLPKTVSKHATYRFYVVGSNLWLLTKYTGPDPEANVTGMQTVQGLDLGTPPQPRSVQVGVNVTL
jgi:TonB-dependent starch-binding outer membrane protein SusC